MCSQRPSYPEFRRWWFLFIFVVVGVRASAQTNGIFADFTTSLGSFTCQLSYSNAPKAVANFIGLATGQRPWLDTATGEVRTNAFYDGLSFHRVISNFVDQAGSPNGLGTDGPGYAVVDEFNSLLNFNTPWILAMANSGPDSNGSQFFVTVAPFTSGNNVYTVFGRVVSGTNVVAAINHVQTDSKDKPLANVYIQQVTIRRVGTAALAFDIGAQGVPVVTNLPVALTAAATNISLVFSNRVYSDSRWYSSTNLQTWTENQVGIDLTPPTTNTVQVPSDVPEEFFRMAQVQYPASTRAPKTLAGRTLVTIFSSGQTNTIVFNNTGGGTYNLPGTDTGTVTSYTWSQEPYRGLLWPIGYSGLYEMGLQLNFSSNTNGVFTGTYYSPPPSSVSGTFKLTGP
jgi:peptidyl-prolyl cis-trans isomerase A (cyclophilin A)